MQPKHSLKNSSQKSHKAALDGRVAGAVGPTEAQLQKEPVFIVDSLTLCLVLENGTKVVEFIEGD